MKLGLLYDNKKNILVHFFCFFESVFLKYSDKFEEIIKLGTFIFCI